MNPPAGMQLLMEFFIEEARVLKAIAKILEKNFTMATLIVTEQGMFLQENNGDPDKNDPVTVILEVLLKRQKFLRYTIPIIEPPGGELCLGFSTSDLAVQLGGVRKTDQMRMYIIAAVPNILHFEITNLRSTSRSTKSVTLCTTKIGRVVTPPYADHIPTVVVEAASFKQTTTHANKNSKARILISAQDRGIKMESPPQIRPFSDYFGQWVPDGEVFYQEWLSTARFHSFSEIATANIAKAVQIYACRDGKPLKLTADAGDLGTISMYLQPEQAAK